MRRSLFVLSFISLVASIVVIGGAQDKPDKQQQRGSGPAPTVEVTPRPKIGGPTPDSVTDRRADIRVDTNMALIWVSVTDPVGRYVTGLDRENFKVVEDKIDQEISQFSSEDAPMSVGVVFDTSGSMGPKLRRSREAVAQFLKTANPEDEFFLVQFNDRPELLVPFTPSPEDLQSRLAFLDSKGRTSLLDGVYMAMNEMKKARNPRKAILIISDGGDNSSRYTESEVKSAVRESDVQIYSIGIFESMAGRNRTPEEAGGPGLLNEISESTGGRFFAADNLGDLPDIAAKIGLELRNQYVLGYHPKNRERDGKFRRVQVKLVKTTGLPQLKATHRPGYYAPAQ